MSHPSRPAAKSVAELIGGTLDPIVRKRGLARAELISWWPDIVGAAYAGRTAPERIRWPRDGTAATLFVRCDPSLSLQFSYETDRVRERLNAYFGYPAVGAVRIVQQAHRARSDDAAPKPRRRATDSGRDGEAARPRRRAARDSLRALGRERSRTIVTIGAFRRRAPCPISPRQRAAVQPRSRRFRFRSPRNARKGL